MEIIRKAAFMIEKERETKIDRERERDRSSFSEDYRIFLKGT
jgi:hypothetical protein